MSSPPTPDSAAQTGFDDAVLFVVGDNETEVVEKQPHLLYQQDEDSMAHGQPCMAPSKSARSSSPAEEPHYGPPAANPDTHTGRTLLQLHGDTVKASHSPPALTHSPGPGSPHRHPWRLQLSTPPTLAMQPSFAPGPASRPRLWQASRQSNNRPGEKISDLDLNNDYKGRGPVGRLPLRQRSSLGEGARLDHHSQQVRRHDEDGIDPRWRPRKTYVFTDTAMDDSGSPIDHDTVDDEEDPDEEEDSDDPNGFGPYENVPDTDHELYRDYARPRTTDEDLKYHFLVMAEAGAKLGMTFGKKVYETTVTSQTSQRWRRTLLDKFDDAQSRAVVAVKTQTPFGRVQQMYADVKATKVAPLAAQWSKTAVKKLYGMSNRHGMASADPQTAEPKLSIEDGWEFCEADDEDVFQKSVISRKAEKGNGSDDADDGFFFAGEGDL